MGSMSQPQNDAFRRSRRIAPLSKLPVFWALEGKRVLVAGGSDGAAWKAELLAACGAELHVFTPVAQIDAAMAALIGNVPEETARGTFVHHDCDWRDAYFRDFAMAVGDIGTGPEAEAFVAAARDAGVPVNVIDKPAYCQFQFGSIVNRSPVVIGISTDGAAPILAQAIRRRVEAVLPPSLQSWARLAARVREQVTTALSPGQARRRFWERFSDRALAAGTDASEPCSAFVEVEIERLSQEAPSPWGSIAIVTVAAGDPDLLTLKAVRALQGCDLVVHDAAIPAGVLEMGRREAERVLSCDSRAEATAECVAGFAAAGRSVVRVAACSAAAFDEYQRLRARGADPLWIPGVAAHAPSGPSRASQRLRLAN